MNAKARKRKREREMKRESQSAAAAPQHRPVVPSSTTTTTTTTTPSIASKKFLTASDGEAYTKLLKEHYKGFVLVPAAKVQASSFHQNSTIALEKLRDSGYYQYDMVLAGGKNLSRTFVQRCLVGNPGITYKYLGLRLFAHAWSGPATPPLFRAIHDMNQEMIRMTKQQQKLAGNTKGSCNYNLTLINYMEPSCDVELKDEEVYGMGKASVSWHADSSLQDYSSIGVYHTLPTQRASKWDWRIALRKNEGNVQPVVVPTKNGDLYFLLGEFNHTHQHMVLAGSSTAHRISSTHRVAVVETDTYDYIRDRVSNALKSGKAQLKQKATVVADWDVDVILESQAVLTEAEFEWIAQYWVQGAQHDVLHVWWQAPMRALEQAWASLEKLTCKIYKAIITASSGAVPPPPRALVEGLITAFKARKELRMKWDERRADKIYKRRISRPFQPVEHPVFEMKDSSKRLPKDLTEAIHALSQVLLRRDSKPAAAESIPHNGKGKKNKTFAMNSCSMMVSRKRPVQHARDHRDGHGKKKKHWHK